MRLGWAASAVLVLLLAACATAPPPKRPASRPRPAPSRPEPPRPAPPPPTAVEPLSSLPGWGDEDHAAALAAFEAGCGVARDAPMRSACARARALGRADESRARAFFEAEFRAAPLPEPGLLTAYFAPEYDARDVQSAEFSAPVRPKPSTLMATAPPPPPPLPDATDSGDAIGAILEGLEPGPVPPLTYQPPPSLLTPMASADRAAIENSPAPDAQAWMRPEDLFFLQIQGSGTLVFPGGRRAKVIYAGDNGRPFVAIARPMVTQGLIGADRASGEGIRGWLASHRGPEADAVMRKDPRYVFFALVPDDGRDPAGAAGVPLPAGHAIAVDPGRHAYGELYWIDASAPILNGAARTYRRLVMALDTGSAIRGEVRADLYVGRGTAAGAEAGRVRHTLHMVRLVPVDR